jgi:hypothetical protein
MAESVEGLESRLRTSGQNDPCPRYPVGLLAIDQMADDIEWAERIRPFCRPAPLLRQVGEDCDEDARRPRENRGGLFEIEVHQRSRVSRWQKG